MFRDPSTQPILMALLALGLGGVVYTSWSILQGAYAEARKATIADAEVSLGDMFLTISPEQVFRISLVISGGLLLLGTIAINPIAGIIFAIAGFLSPRMYFALARDKRRLVFSEQLVDALGMMANSLRAGLTLPQALELVVREMKPPITQEFGRVLQDYRLGTDLDEAMLAMARRVGSRDLDVLVNSIMITRRSGGNVGEIFGSIAMAIRERFRVEGKLRAMASTGTAQALLMSAMPFALMAVLFFVERKYVVLLFSTNVGLVAVGVVVFLVVASFFWIRKIMDIDI
ncbi:MAG: type II secretion system F family protein [Candidatus Binatia bacterium]